MCKEYSLADLQRSRLCNTVTMSNDRPDIEGACIMRLKADRHGISREESENISELLSDTVIC